MTLMLLIFHQDLYKVATSLWPCKDLTDIFLFSQQMDQTTSGDNVWIQCGQGGCLVQSIPKFTTHNAEQRVLAIVRELKKVCLVT